MITAVNENSIKSKVNEVLEMFENNRSIKQISEITGLSIRELDNILKFVKR